MISLKKYLEMDEPGPPMPQDRIDLETMKCYCGVLTSIGKNAIRIVPGLGADLEANLRGLGCRLSVDPTAEALKQASTKVEVFLEEWGERIHNSRRTRLEAI